MAFPTATAAGQTHSEGELNYVSVADGGNFVWVRDVRELIDEDTLITESDTQAPTQGSVKAYVDFQRRTYRATIDTGITEAAADIGDALSALAATIDGTKWIHIPAGNYTMSTAITADADVFILGDPGPNGTNITLTGVTNFVEHQAGREVRVVDLNFSGGGHVIRDPNVGASASPHIEMRGVTMDGGRGLLWWNIGDVKVDELIITDCRATNLTAEAILANFSTCDRITIRGNFIQNVIRKGIQVGYPDDAAGGKPSDTLLSVTIDDNTIDGVSGTGEVKGIFSFASYVSITSNNVYDITGPADSTEGIYTQGRDVIVANNQLENAGTTEAMINIKGIPRTAGIGEDVVDKPGWRIVVSNNTLYADAAAATRPFNIVGSDVLFQGNVVHGGSGSTRITAEGGFVGGRVSMVGNTWVDIESFVGVDIQVNHTDVQFVNNFMSGVRPATGTLYGMIVDLQGDSQIVKISNNVFNQILAADGTTGRAIFFNGDVNCDLLEVTGNSVHTALRAIDFNNTMAGTVNLIMDNNTAFNITAAATPFNSPVFTPVGSTNNNLLP